MKRADLLHVAIVGDEGVGKSSIVRRYKGEEFDETARITIGIDETIRKLTIADQEYKISVADVPGQEKLGSATTLTFRGFQGVLLTFDLTNRESFESLAERLAEMDRLIKEGLPKE
ncbi:Ras-related protein Rab-30, partial [Balamuthia mandrillaris]